MKTQTISRFVAAMVVAFGILLGFGTAMAVPPPAQEFESRLNFGGTPDPMNASAPWSLTNIKQCNTTSWQVQSGSLHAIPQLQSWVDIDRTKFTFNISPGGTGSFDVWIPVSVTGGTGGACKIRIRGTFRETSRQETVAPATVSYSGTAYMVESSGKDIKGWVFTGGKVIATGDFTREVFETCPNSILFPMDQSVYPRRGPKGFSIIGTFGPPVPTTPPAPQFAPEMATLGMEPATVMLDDGLKVLEEAGPAVTDEQIDAVLTEMEEAVGIRRRGGK